MIKSVMVPDNSCVVQ